MKLKSYLLASALIVLPPAAASAAPPVPFTWTGMYVGASGGLITQGTTGYDPSCMITCSVGKYNVDSAGGIFGVNGGYNLQMGMWVWGFETDFSATSLDRTLHVSPSPSTVSSKLTDLGTARLRFGYTFGQFMVYATGGFAYGHVKNGASWEQDPNYTVSESKMKTGWTGGGGFEWLLLNGWTARAEVLYVDLGRSTTNPAPSGCRFGFKNTYTIGRFGLNFRF